MVKRLLILMILILGASVLSIKSEAQTTTINATITDSDGQTWNNGTFSAVFIPVGTNQTQCNGSIFISGPVTGNLTSGGTLNVALQQNTNCFPTGSTWQFSICPNASAACTTIKPIVATGATLNESANFSSQVIAPRFPASGVTTARGYADVEVTPTPLAGGSYWNVNNSCQRIFSGSVWACNGTSFPANPNFGVQVNSGGVFASSSNFTFNPGTNVMGLIGTENVTGPLNVTGITNLSIIEQLENYQYVDSFLSRGGIDIGQEINLAYTAGPATGVTVIVAPGTYNYTTPIVATTSNKPITLQCGYGASSLTGTILNYVSTTGIGLQITTGLSSRIKGCSFVGLANNNASVGLALSNSGAGANTQFIMEGSTISTFGTCLLVGNNVYLVSIRETALANCTKDVNYPNTVTGSGESFNFSNGLIQGVIGSYSATAFDIEANAETINVSGTSFDSAGITLNGGGINFTMTGGNLENLSSPTTADFFATGSSCVQCAATLNGVNLLEDQNNVRTHIITNGAAGSHLTINGGKFFLGSTTGEAALINNASGAITSVINPFLNFVPTIGVITGGGAYTSVMNGITTSNTEFILNGTSWTAGVGPPSGSCIGGSGIYTNSTPVDCSHVLYVCAGNVWTAITCP